MIWLSFLPCVIQSLPDFSRQAGKLHCLPFRADGLEMPSITLPQLQTWQMTPPEQAALNNWKSLLFTQNLPLLIWPF